MRITVIGAGYVGLVSGACFANVGHDVICHDVDQSKIERLNGGEIPIYEPGLEPIVRENRAAGRLTFTADINQAVSHGQLLFIAVGTPPGEDGSADLSHVLDVARAIGERMQDYKAVVTKSTVPVGTSDKVHETIEAELKARGVRFDFDAASNPEFLKEGQAVGDFLRPDRIIIGTESDRARRLLREAYAPLNRNHERTITMGIRSAELTKYAANAMLATRISFMNELANLAEVLDVDIDEVRRGVGSDSRIGFDFLYAGCGFGGSCFPKDVRALNHTSRMTTGAPLKILDAVDDVNRRQKRILFNKVLRYFDGNLAGRTIALWGLAFKPNTDDMREASSLVLIDELLDAGVHIQAFDPVAAQAASALVREGAAIDFAPDAMSALRNADALVIVTEWTEFRAPDFERVKKNLSAPNIFDGRNLYDPQEMERLGFYYEGIGRRVSSR